MIRLFRKPEPVAQKAPTWRSVEPARRRSPASGTAREHQLRRAVRLWSGVLLACGLVVSLGYGYVILREQVEKTAIEAPSTALREVAFTSDGVLDTAWALEFLGQPVGMSMNRIDPSQVKAELESNRQVRLARVSLQYPDRLRITVEERVPLLRARVAGENGPEDLLFAVDGVGFRGLNYPEASVRHLPYLEGVRLRLDPSGHGYEPVEGLAVVEELLKAAQAVSPELLADWRRISLERFRGGPGSPGSLLIARGRQVPEVVFAPTGFREQLVQLARIREYAAEAGQRRLARVDLSFGDQAYVTWQAPATAAAAATPARRAR